MQGSSTPFAPKQGLPLLEDLVWESVDGYDKAVDGYDKAVDILDGFAGAQLVKIRAPCAALSKHAAAGQGAGQGGPLARVRCVFLYERSWRA
jgi:hypothetical protein